MASQKCPSEVLASPMVQKQTSLPLLLKCVKASLFFAFLKQLEAKARPRPRIICPAVGAISAETL